MLFENYKVKIWTILNELQIFEAIENILRKIEATKKAADAKKPKAAFNKILSDSSKSPNFNNGPTKAEIVEHGCLEVLIGSLKLCPMLLRRSIVGSRQRALEFPYLRFLLTRLEAAKTSYLQQLYNDLFHLLILDYEDNYNPKQNLKDKMGRQVITNKDHLEVQRALHETMMIKVFFERILQNVATGGYKAINSLKILRYLAAAHPEKFASRTEKHHVLEYIFAVLECKEKELIRIAL